MPFGVRCAYSLRPAPVLPLKVPAYHIAAAGQDYGERIPDGLQHKARRPSGNAGDPVAGAFYIARTLPDIPARVVGLVRRSQVALYFARFAVTSLVRQGNPEISKQTGASGRPHCPDRSLVVPILTNAPRRRGAVLRQQAFTSFHGAIVPTERNGKIRVITAYDPDAGQKRDYLKYPYGKVEANAKHKGKKLAVPRFANERDEARGWSGAEGRTFLKQQSQAGSGGGRAAMPAVARARIEQAASKRRAAQVRRGMTNPAPGSLAP